MIEVEERRLRPLEKDALAATKRVVHERDYAEIAAATGSSEPAVRQRVSRALNRLRSKEDLR